MTSANPLLRSLAERSADQFDLTAEVSQRQVIDLAEALVSQPADQVAALARAHGTPLEFRIAAKLASSRQAMLQIDRPVRTAVVFAMWGEQRRLRPRADDNPHGEDSLRVKLDQLSWVTAETPVEWRLYAVDDGCPDGSGAIAEEMAAGHPMGERATVLYLADAVPAAEGPLRNLSGADESRKAGAIILGCQAALAAGSDAVVYTDADNSVHLGQLGLLLGPFVNEGTPVVLGNRQDPNSVLVKEAARWGIGIKSLRHMQRMVGEAIFSRGIADTQAAFKLYESSVLSQIIEDPTVFDFSFDTDWLAAVISGGVPFTQVPFAFVDSAVESASVKQQPMTTWETLLLGLLAAMRRHELLTGSASKEMADVVESEIASSSDLDLIIDVLPPELEDVETRYLGDPSVMSPSAMAQFIQAQKRLAKTRSSDSESARLQRYP